jgi:hypothetical protein
MQIYAPDMQIYVRNMHEICTKNAKNMQLYAPDMHLICRYMQKICNEYAEICTKHAEKMQKYAPDMHLICNEYARNMQEYAGICIGACFAYFAYICTPHFADDAFVRSSDGASEPFGENLKEHVSHVTQMTYGPHSEHKLHKASESRQPVNFSNRKCCAKRKGEMWRFLICLGCCTKER